MREFLDELRARQPVLHQLVVAGLGKLARSELHGLPLTRPVAGEHNLYELRVGKTNIARVFFFYGQKQEIVVTHGYVKKQQKLDRSQVDRARICKHEWEERFR